MYSTATAGAVACHDSSLSLTVGLARDSDEIRQSQALRYQVFSEEMGAQLPGCSAGLDVDRFDEHCQHLLVRDSRTRQVLGSTRILMQSDARVIGGFYSETEFDLGRILTSTRCFMEIGRTCVHPQYRSGVVIGMLWSAIATFMTLNRVDYLMGCASIPMGRGPDHVHAIMERLRDRHYAPVTRRTFPRTGLPEQSGSYPGRVEMPALLKAYLRIGVEVCGEPHWDRNFNVADVFVLLDRRRINERYLRHFLKDAPVVSEPPRVAA